MKTKVFFAALAVVALVMSGTLIAADPAGGTTALKCPVSGKPVNPEATVAFNGGKVAFCCPNCPKAFTADSSKYAAKANLQLVKSGQLKQTACPLTGKPVNETVSVDVDGAKVGLCCKNCLGKVTKATEDERINMVFNDTSKGYKPAQ